MRRLRPLLPQWCDEDGGEGEEGHSPQDLQRVNDPLDERKRTNVKRAYQNCHPEPGPETSSGSIDFRISEDSLHKGDRLLFNKVACPPFMVRLMKEKGRM
jgi:hypothetical protein